MDEKTAPYSKVKKELNDLLVANRERIPQDRREYLSILNTRLMVEVADALDRIANALEQRV